MVDTHEHVQPDLHLPIAIVGRMDVARLLRELDALDNFLEAAVLREPNDNPKLPKTSRLFDEMIQQNKLEPLLEADRRAMREFLEKIRNSAPLMHMSFSSDPSPLFLQKLVTWLRTNIGPTVLLQVGLQPTIGAGCILRTTNRHFDFSLRQKFVKEKNTLINKLHTLKDHSPIAPTVPVESAPKLAYVDPRRAKLLSSQPVVPLTPGESPAQRRAKQ